MDKEVYKKLYKEIDEILWNDWNPLGLNHVENVRDEYLGYVPVILGLKIHNATQGQIADKLYEIESKTMGMTGLGNEEEKKEFCRNIAQKILDLEIPENS